MKIEKPYLFIIIGDKSFFFLVLKYDENLNFEIIDSNNIIFEGIKNNKITDVNKCSSILRNEIEKVEKKINYTFKSTIIIFDQDDASCVNITGFKKLNGLQIQNEDIEYILNNLKKLILENETGKNLIHLFNSKFILDKNEIDNLPIGLHGEFYSQMLSFFLIPENNLKNLKLVLNKCNLNIERFFLKSFIDGALVVKEEATNKSFTKIVIKKDKINLTFFENSSFIYVENFKFGSNILLNDVKKVCALKENIVQKIFHDICFDSYLNNDLSKDEYLDKAYFKEELFRKIRFSHIHDIISSRIIEITNIIYNKNLNLEHLRKKNKKIIISFQDLDIYENLKNNFKENFSNELDVIIKKETHDEHVVCAKATAEIFAKGWKTEAIPVVHTKKSMISKIFSIFFD